MSKYGKKEFMEELQQVGCFLLVVATVVGVCAVGHGTWWYLDRDQRFVWCAGRDRLVEVRFVDGTRQVFRDVKVTYEGPVVQFAGTRLELNDEHRFTPTYRTIAVPGSQIVEVLKHRTGTPEYEAAIGMWDAISSTDTTSKPQVQDRKAAEPTASSTRSVAEPDAKFAAAMGHVRAAIGDAESIVNSGRPDAVVTALAAARRELEIAKGAATRSLNRTLREELQRQEAAFADVMERLKSLPPLKLKFTQLPQNQQGYPEYKEERTGIVFVALPGGKFRMGSPEGEAGRGPDEGPVHEVELSPFLIAKYELTQTQWERVMGSNPPEPQGSDVPVKSVSWQDCTDFCRITGLELPTEARWEYACRAGTSGPYAGTGRLKDLGWYNDNGGRTTHPVGEKPPNGFGLYDMHGNVWEWCEDVYDSGFYAKAEARRKDPVSTSGSGGRVYRGGSWWSGAGFCRSATRYGGVPGFRGDIVGFRPTAPVP